MIPMEQVGWRLYRQRDRQFEVKGSLKRSMVSAKVFMGLVESIKTKMAGAGEIPCESSSPFRSSLLPLFHLWCRIDRSVGWCRQSGVGINLFEFTAHVYPDCEMKGGSEVVLSYHFDFSV